MNGDVLTKLVERVEGRFFGKYRGVVASNADPLNLGRLQANVPRILGAETTGWAVPAFAYGGASEQGFFAVPDAGAGVWIEFEEGDLSYPIWTGTWYQSGQIPESATPKQKVLKTASGHKLVLDDDAKSLTITDANGNVISLDSNAIKLTAGQATQIVIDGPQIQLVANSSHPLVFGDGLLQYLTQLVQTFNTHMHPGESTAAGPVTPAPPTPPATPPDPSLLSQKVTTG
jgi:phage baseplate assembly protein gpV